MGSGFVDWIYWHFVTITINYDSSHIELILEQRLSDESLTNLGPIFTTLEFTNQLPFIAATVNFFRCHENIFVQRPATQQLFVAAGTWLPSRCSAVDFRSGFQPSCHNINVAYDGFLPSS
jgi:hypothetical protein